MSLYMKLSQKPQQFLTLTGIERSEFERLLLALARFNLQEQQPKVRVVHIGAERQRQPDGNAQYANPLPDRCLLLLLYNRLYVSQGFLTLLFIAASSLICRGIQSVRLLWEGILPLPERVQQRILTVTREVSKLRRKRSGSLGEFREAYLEIEFLFDEVALVFSEEQIGGATSL
jgi:hypothetical protein